MSRDGVSSIERVQRILDESEKCRLGPVGYERERYCHEHFGFVYWLQARPICDRHPVNDDPAWSEIVRMSQID